jgi:hypothetical protein
MASISAEAARPAQKQQARRPVSRIVPAIPHRLSRRVPAATPSTSVPSHKAPVTQQKQESEPEPQAQQPAVEEKQPEEQPEEQQQPAPAGEAAPVPEVKTAAEQPEPVVEAVPPALASSPTKPQAEEAQQPAEVQGECRVPSEALHGPHVDCSLADPSSWNPSCERRIEPRPRGPACRPREQAADEWSAPKGASASLLPIKHEWCEHARRRELR